MVLHVLLRVCLYSGYNISGHWRCERPRYSSISDPGDTTPQTKDELIRVCNNKTTIYVGNILLEKQACLLTTARDYFLKCANKMLPKPTIHLECDLENLVSSRWVLSNLVLNLKHHITYHCSVLKYGTVLYRPNTDLLLPLCRALHTVRSLEEKQKQNHDIVNVVPEKAADNVQVLNELNRRVHSQIKQKFSKISKYLLTILK